MALKTACNAADCVKILQGLRYFIEWRPLKNYFRIRTKLVFTFLIEYIASVMEMFYNNKYYIPHYMPKYSGVCIMAIIQFNNITELKNVNSCTYYYHTII